MQIGIKDIYEQNEMPWNDEYYNFIIDTDNFTNSEKRPVYLGFVAGVLVRDTISNYSDLGVIKNKVSALSQSIVYSKKECPGIVVSLDDVTKAIFCTHGTNDFFDEDVKNYRENYLACFRHIAGL